MKMLFLFFQISLQRSPAPAKLSPPTKQLAAEVFLKIIVLLKKTPDTEAKINISSDHKAIEQSGVKFIMNPYDEYAVEEALKIKAQAGTGEVLILSFGDDSVKDPILKALAMGADRGLQVSNENLSNADGLTTAKILSHVIKQENADLVLCGKQAIDDDNMHVGVMTAQLLDWPHANVVTKIELKDKTAKVEREVEAGQVEHYEIELPAVLGAHKSLNTPRYASLPGIMKAKKKPFDRKTLADTGLSLEELQSNNHTQIESFSYPAEKPAGKVFKDAPTEEMIDKVVNLLREEAKVL